MRKILPGGRRRFIMFLAAAFSLSGMLLLFTGSAGENSEELSGGTQIPILLYHSVSDDPIGIPILSVTTKDFDEQMSYLASNGYTTYFVDEMDACSQDKKPVIITFDDGYVDNFTNAYPVLEKYKLKATIFVITKAIGSKGHLSAEQMEQMSDLVSFQSHTVDHVRMDRLNKAQIDYECGQSQKDLNRITGKPVDTLSYPNGKFSANVLTTAQKYYQYAVTTLQGFNTPHSSRYKMKRTQIGRSDSLSVFISRLQP